MDLLKESILLNLNYNPKKGDFIRGSKGFEIHIDKNSRY